tara:strand:+ start:44 stop:1693 length:1650 start_codon:yes stop_codon:yes gene_type:complete
MSNLPARNRVIYQSEALFVSPDTTGHHLYYVPPYNATGVDGETQADRDDRCLVKGLDVNGNQLTFDACGGFTLQPNGDPIEDFRFKTFSCNLGSGEAWTGENQTFSNVHPVLQEVGFTQFESTFHAETGVDVNGFQEKGLKWLHANQSNPYLGSWGTAARQLKRVQNANYSFTINRQDVNQFGQLARIDSVILESPTVSMDFSYYLTDAENERLLGMSTNGKFQSLSGIMTRAQNEYGNNFFILTVPEGRDAVQGDISADDADKTVISAGNVYITDYSIEGSVGSFPTASVSLEALNIKSDVGAEFKNLPSVDSTDGTKICDTCFILPPAETGDGSSVLKPGDISIDLKNAGLLSKQMSGDSLGYGAEDKGSAHIQSFTISTPMGRTSLQRLGNTYAFAKEIDFPVTCTLSVNALVSDLKDGNLVDLMCGGSYDLRVKMQDPKCIDCNPNTSEPSLIIDFKGAVLDSESFSSAIGDNKTVDLTFSTQIGGPEDNTVGVFISGNDNQVGADGKWMYPPAVKGGKFFEYGEFGTTGNASWSDDSSRGHLAS